MTIERFDVGGRMSQAVAHGGLLYLSGQIPSLPNGADCAAQAREVLAKIDRLLTKAGSSRGRILLATVYLKSMSDFAAFNEVWDEWVDGAALPARACVEAKLASPDWLVEISVIATC